MRAPLGLGPVDGPVVYAKMRQILDRAAADFAELERRGLRRERRNPSEVLGSGRATEVGLAGTYSDRRVGVQRAPGP